MNRETQFREYVHAVTRGAGLLPWQSAEMSAEETAFRAEMEARKTSILERRQEVAHPFMLSETSVDKARRNIENADWAQRWAENQKAVADAIAAMDSEQINDWIPEVTAAHTYGFTCPNCVGRLSQEGTGPEMIQWDYRDPDHFACNICGQTYPDEKYPEDAVLQCPRRGVTLHYFRNDREKEADDHTGQLSYRWVGFALHMNFTLLLRTLKMRFLLDSLDSLTIFHRLTGERPYAEAISRILVRLSHCYPKWLYHDYWDTVADCDPLYAAWHDMNLPFEFKRHLSEEGFQRDTAENARMLQCYWGAGRAHPDTGDARFVVPICTAYDSLLGSADGDLLTTEQRNRIERDLILEWVMESEFYIGGPGKAEMVNNKAPRIYAAMAAAGVCLGAAQLADVGLKGYEIIRDKAFNADGFSTETPVYTMMYLDQIVKVPDILDGFAWPSEYRTRKGVVQQHETDEKLRLMFRAQVDQLRPDGRHLPLGDTMVNCPPAWFMHIYERGLHHYPEHYRGWMPTLYRGGTPDAPVDYRKTANRSEPLGTHALLNCDYEDLEADLAPAFPEIFFPNWMTGILRHGSGREASVLSMTFSPPGGHRQHDNLALFYADGQHEMIGDLGYVCDMPVNKWVRETFSHNEVIVDDEQQITGDDDVRKPVFRWMFTSPVASGLEASTWVYRQCTRYRRTVLLVKGPEGRTFTIDLFRVSGGNKHDYRLFSELAASNVQDTEWEMAGLTMPPETPFPDVAGSLDPKDIFGLRDTRTDANPPPAWQAIWKQPDRHYRLWCLTQCSRVEASNGPGQETRGQDTGRRTRYIGLIHEGKDVETTFVVLHEPSNADCTFAIQSIERMETPPEAGPDAVALRIVSDWGNYLFLNEFEQEAEVDEVRFKGTAALMRAEGIDLEDVVSIGASTLEIDGSGFSGAPDRWAGEGSSVTDSEISTTDVRPKKWPETPEGCRNWVAVQNGTYWTGYPVIETGGTTIRTDRFPLEEVREFRLPALRYYRV